MASISQIRAQIAQCTAEYNELFDKKCEIQGALAKVNSAKADFDSINASNSFKWIRDNMDTYWNAAESTAREGISNKLDSVITDISSGGGIASAVSSVTAAAGKKIDELTQNMEEKAREIKQLTAALKEALAAEAAENAE